MICNLGLFRDELSIESDEEVQLICSLVECFNNEEDISIIEKLILSIYRWSEDQETYFHLIFTLGINLKKIEKFEKNLVEYFEK
jgi:hypothetical protein